MTLPSGDPAPAGPLRLCRLGLVTLDERSGFGLHLAGGRSVCLVAFRSAALRGKGVPPVSLGTGGAPGRLGWNPGCWPWAALLIRGEGLRLVPGRGFEV